MKKIAVVIGLIFLVGWTAFSIFVELEADNFHEYLGGEGKARALVLFHPSRDARFSDDLSLAFADGLKEAGLAVERATLTGKTPDKPEGYALVAVVSNTFYWTPDVPTLRYLKRARLDGVSAVGLICGGGFTGRAKKILDQALRNTGANVFETRPFWLRRPNDENPTGEPTRLRAMKLAKQFGMNSGKAVLAAKIKMP